MAYRKEATMNNHDKIDCGTGKEMRPLNSSGFGGLSVDNLCKTIARSENYTIRLPKDRYGKTVLIGDMVKSQEDRGRIREVIGIRLSKNSNVWSLEFHVSEGGSEFVPANRCYIVEPDTQEKIDADVLLDSCTYFGAELCAECPNFEDGYLQDCSTNKIQDLLRRQRTLFS